MKRVWVLAGQTAFWLSWPALWLYLRMSRRTRVLVVAERKILVVKGWLGAGDWLLPGGGLHRDEDPRAGAVREVSEETGVQLKPKQLTHLFAATASRHGLRYKYDCYLAELPKTIRLKSQKIEIVDCAWLAPETFTINDPNDEIGRALRAWLQR